jgi:predicted PurR-regulated permease PerM
MRQRTTLIFLGVVLIVLIPFAWRIAQPFATSFVLACVLAMIVDPLHQRLDARIGKPGPAALLTTFLTLLVVIVPLSLVGFALTRELRSVYLRITQMSKEGGGWQALFLSTSDRVFGSIGKYLPIDEEKVREEALTHLKDLAGSMLNMAGAAFGGVTATLFTAFGVMILLYFVLRYGRQWLAESHSLLPLDRETVESIRRTVHDTIVANVNGLLAVAAAQGFLLGLGFLILGLPSPVTWGLIGSLTSMIPVVGIMLVWAPFVVGLAVMGAYMKAVLLLAWSALLVGSADNVIRPLVVRGRVNQHPMLIVLSIIGGTTAFGAMGLLIGPVVVSLVIALVTELRKRLAQVEDGAAPTGRTAAP